MIGSGEPLLRIQHLHINGDGAVLSQLLVAQITRLPRCGGHPIDVGVVHTILEITSGLTLLWYPYATGHQPSEVVGVLGKQKAQNRFEADLEERCLLTLFLEHASQLVLVSVVAVRHHEIGLLVWMIADVGALLDQLQLHPHLLSDTTLLDSRLLDQR